jgi:hypothetical protein
MKNYIRQLIDDIRLAGWNIRPPHEIWQESEADPLDEGELEDISYVEEYIYGKKEKISDITGIDSMLLPPPDKLSKEDRALLSTELEKLLQVFHFHLDFPENYPAHLRYPFILGIWDDEYVPLSFGTSHIEFCDYDEQNCPFPGYCNTCREYKDDL